MTSAIINEARLNRIVQQCIFESLNPRMSHTNRLTEKRVNQIVNDCLQKIISESNTGPIARRIPFTNANKYIRKPMLMIDNFEKAWKEMGYDINGQQQAEPIGTVQVRSVWNTFVQKIIDTATNAVAQDGVTGNLEDLLDPQNNNANNGYATISLSWDSVMNTWKNYSAHVAGLEFQKVVMRYKFMEQQGTLPPDSPSLYDWLWSHNIGVSTNSNNYFLMRGQQSNATSSQSDPIKRIINNLSGEEILEMFYEGQKKLEQRRAHNQTDISDEVKNMDMNGITEEPTLYVWYSGVFMHKPSQSDYEKASGNGKGNEFWKGMTLGSVFSGPIGCLSSLFGMLSMGVGLCTVLIGGCSHACSRDTTDNDEDTPENNTEVIYSKPESQDNPFVSPEQVERNRRTLEMYSNKKYKP